MRKERGRGPAGLDAEDLDAEEIERYYRNRCVILVESYLLSLSYQSEHGVFDRRYNEDAAAIARFGEGGEEMSDEITQQTLLPGVKDPNLWMVKCRIGEEKTTVLQLMRKMIAYQHEEEPLQIR